MKKNHELIRLSKSCIGKSEKKSVLDVLNKEYLGMGSEVNLFEQKLTDFLKFDIKFMKMCKIQTFVCKCCLL